MRKLALTFGLSILAGTALAQSPDLSFEVASVKPAVMPQSGQRFVFGKRGGPGTSDPGRITWSGATLKGILADAWDMKNYQVTGPAWLGTERYDIIAKVPPGATKEQVNLMWRNLLAERFGVVLHHQSKEFQAAEMVAAKGGMKLQETTLDANAGESSEPPAPPPFDKNGIPQLKAPGLIGLIRRGPNGPELSMVGKAQTMSQLATTLGDQLKRPVVDKTGLTGKYDFVVDYSPDPGSLPMLPGSPPSGPPPGDAANAPEPSGLTLEAALQQQLGLRLVNTKANLDTLVIDHAEKTPTAN